MINRIAQDLLNSLPEESKRQLQELEQFSAQLGLSEIDPQQFDIRLKQLKLRHQANQTTLSQMDADLDTLKHQRQHLSELRQELERITLLVDDMQNLTNPDIAETISLKLQEYQGRLKKHKHSEDQKLQYLKGFCAFVEDVQEWDRAQKELQELRERYCGLPPDLQQAQALVHKAEAQVEQLTKQRDLLMLQAFPDRGKRSNKK